MITSETQSRRTQSKTRSIVGQSDSQKNGTNCQLSNMRGGTYDSSTSG